jgi:hypothetical protein
MASDMDIALEDDNYCTISVSSCQRHRFASNGAENPLADLYCLVGYSWCVSLRSTVVLPISLGPIFVTNSVLVHSRNLETGILEV